MKRIRFAVTALALLAGSLDYNLAAADVPMLQPPRVLERSYEGLDRWCGADELVINSQDGLVLYRLGTVAGPDDGPEKVSALLVNDYEAVPDGVGCLLHNATDLSYWKLKDLISTSGLWLTLQRLRMDPRKKPLQFHRDEVVSLPGGFADWGRADLDLYLAYYRPCGGLRAPAEAGNACVGAERINLATLDREIVLEQPAPRVEPGFDISRIVMIRDDEHPTALINGDKSTTICRLDTSPESACRTALAEPLDLPSWIQPRLLTRDRGGRQVVGLYDRALVCDAWPGETEARSKPLCRILRPHAAGITGPVELRATLPNGQVLAEVDHCLSLGELDLQTGEVRGGVCLLGAIRDSVPARVGRELIAVAAFEEEVDGVTIPAWNAQLSPSGKWLAIQVPEAGCDETIPEPETIEPRRGIGGCGRLLIWPTEAFLR